MGRLAVIGGTGLTSIEGLETVGREMVHTPWGAPSGPVVHGLLAGHACVFLARHGHHHTIPPHQVNYRANIWALKELDVSHVVAIAAVGGIDAELAPGSLVVPDQIIDYTWGRAHTFFEEKFDGVVHVDFTEPYDVELRAALVRSARAVEAPVRDGGTYGATQGPRLESAAEIARMRRDGCDLVGMTGMPEAGLAREAELAYAHCAVIANPAAGLAHGPITMEEIRAQLDIGMRHVRDMLGDLVARFPA
jgi:5'-methylthioinosine phosphorylase